MARISKWTAARRRLFSEGLSPAWPKEDSTPSMNGRGGMDQDDCSCLNRKAPAAPSGRADSPTTLTADLRADKCVAKQSPAHRIGCTEQATRTVGGSIGTPVEFCRVSARLLVNQATGGMIPRHKASKHEEVVMPARHQSVLVGCASIVDRGGHSRQVL